MIWWNGSNGITEENKMRIVLLVTNSGTPWCMRRTAHAKKLTTSGAFCTSQGPAFLCAAYLAFNSDFNYIRDGDECVPVGPEPIPAGVCENERKEEKYKGSSGYRLVPGNTCEKEGGVVMDEPVEKPCSQGAFAKMLLEPKRSLMNFQPNYPKERLLIKP